MKKKFLQQLQARAKKRLTELRTRLEQNEVREEELEAVNTEIAELGEEVAELDEAIANADDEETDPEEDPEQDLEKDEDLEKDDPEKDPEQRSGIISSEQRTAAMTAIKSALSTRNAKSTKQKEKEIRSAFANFVVGNISEQEARSLGVDINNGSVTVPIEISREIITYAQEENLLRKYGSYVATDADVKYPVLIKKAEAQGHKAERTNNEIPETDIDFDSIDLDPTEFDALATITKKLLKRTGVKIEQIVIDELKKAYVRKETQYMFRGDEAGNLNPGSLANKAVAYYESETVGVDDQKLYKQLVLLKNQPVTEVLKKSMWIINRAALTRLEGMLDLNGRPLLYEAPNGVGYKLLGHNVDFTDAADGTDSTKPVFYFGDFKAFHIQEIKGGMELQKLVEKFAGTNKVGFQIYNLIDGQLVYSPFEPAVYRYEVGATAPVGG